MRTLTINRDAGKTWRDTVVCHGRLQNFEAEALANFHKLAAKENSDSQACLLTTQDLRLIPRFEMQNTGPIDREITH